MWKLKGFISPYVSPRGLEPLSIGSAVDTHYIDVKVHFS